MPHKSGIGAIFGIVSEEGVAKVASPVALYDRTTFNLVAKTVTDGDGGYVFTGLDPNTSDYLVMATDEDGGTPKNAIVADRIQPIPAYSGATFMANWVLLARRLNPAVLVSAEVMDTGANAQFVDLAPNGQYVPGANYASEPFSGTVTFNVSSGTPGAPFFPQVRCASGMVFLAGTKGRQHFTGSESPLRVSFEVAANTDADFTTYVPFGNGAGPVVALQWLRSSQRMRVLTWQNGDSRPNQQASIYKVFHDYSPSLPDGVHHFVVVVEYGTNVKLYTDGALTNTLSLAGTVNQPGTFTSGTNYDRPNGLLFGHLTSDADNWGNDRSTVSQRYGSGALAAGAFYPALLTGTQVTDLYNALMVGSSPLATGYAKEVALDTPICYYQLREASGTSFAEFMGQSRPMVLSGTGITYGAVSPVSGGSAIQFSGAVLVCRDISVMANPHGFACSFWINPDAGAPGADQIIWLSESGAAAELFSLRRRVTTGRFRLNYRQGGSLVSTDFTTAPTASTWTHVAIVFDRIAATAKLYINATLTETISTGGGLLDRNRAGSFIQNDSSIGRAFMVGGYVSPADARSLTFAGKLTEVAFYARTLSAARVQALYDARLTP